MKYCRKVTILNIIFIIFYSIVSFAYSQPLDTRCVIKKDAPMWSVWWSTEDEELLVKISKPDRKVANPGDYVLSAFRSSDKVYKAIYKYELGGTPFAVFPIGIPDNSRLAVVSVRGSGYDVSIFKYMNGIVTKVFTSGSKWMPEFIHIPIENNRYKHRLIVSKVEWDKEETEKNRKASQKTISSDIYEWSYDGYELIVNIPWEKRFDENLNTE